MKKQSNSKIAGSYLPVPAMATLGEIDRNEIIQVTVRLRRRKEPFTGYLVAEHLSRETYKNEYAASKEDADAVETFAHSQNLSTVEVDLARRSVILSGNIADIETAFGVILTGQVVNNVHYRMLTSAISVPADLKDVIVGVFGLDNRPAARPMFQVAKNKGEFISHAAAPQAFTADQLAKIYGFPSGVTGKGQCIAIIELGGGYRTADITNYFKQLGMHPPVVKAIAVDGGANSPSSADSADGEVMLDIEVAGAVAPAATLAIYFAPNTDQGFLNAITKAIHDTHNKPSVISISWGAAEVNWTKQALDNFNEAFKTAAALGITVCAAAGDTGSNDGVTDGKVHVDFPSSSPYVLSCGGTQLKVDQNKIASEVVWHESTDSATGGGVSDYFPLPDYQINAPVPLSVDTKFKGRGVPDVAGNADPNTGYKVLVDGQQLIIGGTSAVAPLMAGLIALINQESKKPAGFIHPNLYANPAFCRDIVKGNNKTTANKTGYTAAKGWDACTGLGVLSRLS